MSKKIFQRGNIVVTVFQEDGRFLTNLTVYQEYTTSEFMGLYDVYCALEVLRLAYEYIKEQRYAESLKAIDLSFVA